MFENDTMSGAGATNSDTAAERDPFLDAYFADEKESDTGNADSATTEPEADQQAGEEQQEKAPDDHADADEAKEYPIKYKGKEQTVRRTQAELIADIQKAMDYDSVKKERDDLKNSAQGAAEALEVMDYFASKNGMTREEYVKFCNDREGISPEDSMLAKVKKEFPDISDKAAQEIAASRMKEANAQKSAAEDDKIQAQLDELTAEYPDVKDVDSLPDEVKAAIANGSSPLEAMRMHELRELRSAKADLSNKLAAIQREKDNHFRSTGPAESKTAGVAADPFLMGYLGGG